MFIQINALLTDYLSVNQEQFIEKNKLEHGDEFVKIIDGDESAPKEIDTLKIYKVEEVVEEAEKIVCSYESDEAMFLRANGLLEVDSFWGGETTFYVR